MLFVYICKFEVDALNSSYSQLDVFKSCVRQVGFYLDPLRELAFGISPYPFFIPHELDFCKFKAFEIHGNIIQQNSLLFKDFQVNMLSENVLVLTVCKSTQNKIHIGRTI